MKISCNNFKIRNIIEGNCKTLYIKDFFFMSIYLIYLLFKILYNLYFLLNSLKNNPRDATANGTLVICRSPNNGWIRISFGHRALDLTRGVTITTISFMWDASSSWSWQSSKREKRLWNTKVETHSDSL